MAPNKDVLRARNRPGGKVRDLEVKTVRKDCVFTMTNTVLSRSNAKATDARGHPLHSPLSQLGRETGGQPGRNKFLIKDRNSGKNYLVDTGACVSTTPATADDRRGHEGETFGEAGGAAIKTYGSRQIPLLFGDGHRFTQTFLVADVNNQFSVSISSKRTG